MLSDFQIYLLGFVAFCTSGILTWPVRNLAIRIGAMDSPTQERKTQKAPVPYLGGVSIALTVCIITYASVMASDSTSSIFPLASYVLVPAFFMALMGIFDDLRDMPPLPRLAMQTIAGVGVSSVLVATDNMGVVFNSPLLNIVVSMVWIVGITNSINFFDNIDGGAAGTVAVATLGISFIAFSRQQELVTALAIVTGGATLGFLLWNKEPAKIYMGDAGALFLGTVLSVLTIRLNPGIDPYWKSLAIPPILLAIPILDTSVAVLSRVKRGISPLHGGMDHLSHRLVRKGMRRRTAAITLWALSAVFGLLAVAIFIWSNTFGTQLIFGSLVLWIALFSWFWKVPSVD